MSLNFRFEAVFAADLVCPAKPNSGRAFERFAFVPRRASPKVAPSAVWRAIAHFRLEVCGLKVFWADQGPEEVNDQ
jgi:hypothetical protein